MLTLEEFEADLDSAIVDLENLAADAPQLFKKRMEGPLMALTLICEEVGNVVDETK